MQLNVWTDCTRNVRKIVVISIKTKKPQANYKIKKAQKYSRNRICASAYAAWTISLMFCKQYTGLHTWNSSDIAI